MVLDAVQAGPTASRPASSSLPTPAGWFALAHLGELGPGRVVARRLAGRELVVFRTRSGKVAALSAHCPHLGAHLGHGGRVEGETIVCPFHGFRFDTLGSCVGTGYGTPPPRGLTTPCAELRLVGEVVLAWTSPEGAPPTFEVPPASADDVGPWSFARQHATGHPQETTENSVDRGHFTTLHGYASVEQLAPLAVDGPHLRIAYRARRPARIVAAGRRDLEIHYEIEAWGLGWSRVDVSVPRYGIRFGQLVLATPTGPGEVDVLLGVAVADQGRRVGGRPEDRRSSERVLRGLVAQLLGSRGFRRVVSSGILGAVVLDVRQDARIWRHKAHVEQPALAVGDGPIVPYRRWASQFYAVGHGEEPPPA